MKALQLHRALDAIWSAPPGWRGWLVSVNHSDIGRRFIVASFVFFAIGGLLAMLIRAQLATPGSAFVTAPVYAQLFTMHGTLMMFLFAIPMFEGFAMYLLPKLLGARDMAFPRLSAYGWWCYLFGGTLLVLSLLAGVAPAGGWFMYTPLTSRTYAPGINADVWLLGVTFVEVSAVCAAVEIAVSVLKVRAPGMSLARLPVMAWYLLATALMMLVGFPPLILGSVLLEVERAFGWPFFDPTRGGDPLLWQHLFWLFGHPEVYIIFLPAAGIVSTVLPVMARVPLMGYAWVVAAVLTLAFLSFGLWVHHMFTVGIPHMALGFFSAASLLVAVPTAVQVFAWLGTLWAGRPRMQLPMLYLVGFFVVFVMGGLTGVMLASVPFDWQAHDSHFVTAHLHYVLVGGFVFPLLAGAYYWLPHFTGNRNAYGLGKAAFWLIFIGFNATFLLMHLTGLLGMPRRVQTYPDDAGWTGLNLLSSVGSFVMAFGFALFAIDVALSLALGRRARRNPWDATTLEWAMPTPAPSYNFASLPHVEQREPLAHDDALPLTLAQGRGYLGRVRGNLRETLGVEMNSGRVEQLVVLPGNTALPIVTAAVTGLFFLSLLFKLYWATPLCAAVLLALAWRWAWVLGRDSGSGAVDIGGGVRVAPHREAAEAPGWWGSIFTLVADAALFGSLLFGLAYLRVVTPGAAPPAAFDARVSDLVAGAASFALAAIAVARAAAANCRAARHRAAWWLLGSAGGLLAGGAVLGAGLLLRQPPAQAHAWAAVSAMLLCYALVHAVIALAMLAYAAARLATGQLDAARALELRVAAHWICYGSGVGALTLALLHAPALYGAGP
ncbi:cytochrome c oxidase subunit I [uncultured Azohydromonas sp.]|uniref:cytochrome c oxidase subunit I n=1 Tax=uncultured Azohydromonas sp. TaxID=487342 RepID=UPI002613ABE2|nr:cytochrome c oxidase subunit I [uncultured Azohydromonas sp.]